MLSKSKILAHKRFNPLANPKIPHFPRENAGSQPSKDHLKFSFKLHITSHGQELWFSSLERLRRGTKILYQSTEVFAFKHKPKLHLPQALPSRCPTATRDHEHGLCPHGHQGRELLPVLTGTPWKGFSLPSPGRHGAVPQSSSILTPCQGGRPVFWVPKVTHRQQQQPPHAVQPCTAAHGLDRNFWQNLLPSQAPAFLG